MARLVSLNVGLPKDVTWQGRTVHTGIFKYPVEGPRLVRRLNVDGDGQGDLGGHGGEIRAVLVYQRESYEHWRRFLGREDLEDGQFGENFTVDGLPDDEVHIGDRYRVGEAEFEVTQPRVTCFRVGMRLGEPRMPALLVAHHRPGFYLRVITEGHVQAGDEIVRTRTGRHELSVADVDALLYLPDRDPETLRKAVDVPALSPGWQASFRDLLAAAPAPAPAGWRGFRPLRVARVVPESASVASIHLTADDGAPLPRPEPGQYLTLRVPGAGDPAPVRSYSLSAAPSEHAYRISVKRDGVVSGYLHTRLAAGATVEVAAPRGDFVLAAGDGPVVLLSAGIGVTPVLAMLHALAASRSEREVWWLHTTRSAAEHAFADEAHRLLTDLPNAHEHVYYTAETGRLTVATLSTLDLPCEATAYLCGPDAFMTAMREALVSLGIDASRVHSELFGGVSAINPGITDAVRTAPHPPAGSPGPGPAVTFARSGLTVPWRESYPSLLEFAEACDVPTRWSCRTGVCHTCVTPVLSGGVEYAPEPLEPAAAGEALICCARPAEDVVLDL
ncbi:MOSC and FAD-binding oxidoreductase domain-containing protein [Amycolatopsis sp. OK19-0408]|uniref:MOSC and FAD-binding oxidoreductase domain-containing protein n=1 Tax=Amycolatopsis iheyensis TaxID=2945988 RepID=A0A9X2SJN4_9PSEU|nr:MOSC and FAD-binding oxidoreductase domain-containing protein [Amycolatopsis iheyensis]MCR6484927.1 MOSC and FAD-binding oxidoreductase domain-containing protein [Amycolatopsis iheyensis]